ncbi:MAG: hypothetical protein LBJ59_03480 [Zoogloeaceae bacterium]|jgi:hypothetical protein|nr:hypothetical protein [Zoogloeaceae bacterium]
MTDPDIRGAFNLPFAEQIAFFRHKLNLPTERWDDIKHEGHDRAFVVAGATKADLLKDLRQAVDDAIDKKTGLEQFRKDFREIVHKHGWTGWTGEGTKAGEAWRTRVIWETNLASSRAAGRYAQLSDPELLSRRPYWKYIHADGVMNPRPQHLAWDGLTLPHDHPFWQTNFPPNGWGCHCRVIAVRAPTAGDKTEPPAGWNAINPKTGAPIGIDKGWAYAPGASVADELRQIVETKAAKLPADLGGAYAQDLDDVGIPRRQLAEDWQGQRPGLFALPPVQVVEMPEMPGLTHRERVAEATTAFKAMKESGLELYNTDSGWVLDVNKESRKKIADNEGQNDASLNAVRALQELVKTAVVTERHPDVKHENPDIAAIVRLYAAAADEGALYRVKLTVKERNRKADQRKILHALEALEIENVPLGTLPTPPKIDEGSTQPTTGRTLTIADLLKGAIRNDGTPFE